MEYLLQADIVSLNHLFTTESPILEFNPPYSVQPFLTHNATFGGFPGGLSGASFVVGFSGQHGAPTIDALGHIGVNGTLSDGGSAFEADGATGLTRLGIDEYPESKYINRGVLIDVPYCLDMDILPELFAITDTILNDCAEKEGVTIQSGDSVLIRTGWGTLFNDDPEAYTTNHTGVSAEAASYLADLDIFLSGMDTLGYDIPNSAFPGHNILIAQNGIYIVENINLEDLSTACQEKKMWEFALVLNPPKMKGLAAMATNAFAVFMPDIDAALAVSVVPSMLILATTMLFLFVN